MLISALSLIVMAAPTSPAVRSVAASRTASLDVCTRRLYQRRSAAGNRAAGTGGAAGTLTVRRVPSMPPASRPAAPGPPEPSENRTVGARPAPVRNLHLRAAAPMSTHPKKPSGRTILVVDDRPDTLTAIRMVLEREGHRVLTADSGSEALTVFDREPVQVLL